MVTQAAALRFAISDTVSLAEKCLSLDPVFFLHKLLNIIFASVLFNLHPTELRYQA